MNCVDVNVIVYAVDAAFPHQADYAAILERLANGAEPLGLFDPVITGFVRIVTNQRLLEHPLALGDALEAVGGLLAAPATTIVRPSERFWPLFVGMCTAIGATGNDVPDAALAAAAVEQGATWWSADRGFARFPGLRWRHPLDA